MSDEWYQKFDLDIIIPVTQSAYVTEGRNDQIFPHGGHLVFSVTSFKLNHKYIERK